jgi:hypothetical protein
MTSWALTFASAIAALIALAHSYLGERRILQPLAAMGMDFGTPERRRSVNATLRFASPGISHRCSGWARP